MKRKLKRCTSLLTAALFFMTAAFPVSAADETTAVRFITSLNERDQTGGSFAETESLSVSNDVIESSYLVLSDGSDDRFTCVSAWDVYYDCDASALGMLPSVEAAGSDVFLGWVDVDGNPVDERTVPEDGAVYTAVYEEVYRAHWRTDRNTESGEPADGDVFDPVSDLETGETEDETVSDVSGSNTEAPDASSTDPVFEAAPGSEPEKQPDTGSDKTLVEDLKPGAPKNESNPVTDSGTENAGTSPMTEDDLKEADKKSDASGSTDPMTAVLNRSGRSTRGTYRKPDGAAGVYAAFEGTGFLTLKKEAVTEDGTPLYQDADGNMVSYVVGPDETAGMIRYLLHVTDVDNRVCDLAVNSEQTLSDVLVLMGYDASRFTIRQAGTKEQEADGNMMFSDLAGLLQTGDLMVSVYGEADTPAGYVTIRQTIYAYEYDVILSVSADAITLRTMEEVILDFQKELPDAYDSEAYDPETYDPETVSDTGEQKPMTVDSAGLLVYTGLGLSVAALLLGYAGYLIMKRKRGR